MLKKITSNRDPRDTLYSELKKEFSIYFTKAGTGFRTFLERNPKPVFMTMVAMMLLSIGLTFSVFRHKQPVQKPAYRHASVSLTGGFNQILQVGSALKEMIALKGQVDSILTKKALTRQDSTTLENDLDKLQQINNALKIKKTTK